MLVLDSHCDPPSRLMCGRDIGLDDPRSHVDLPKLKAGGVDAAFFALYTPKEQEADAATRYALEMAGAVFDALAGHAGQAVLALNPRQIRTNKRKGLVSILLGMENGSPIQESLSLLRLFYRLGVRYMTLTHNADNAIADAAAEGRRWHGLSPFGREVVAEMNRIGMIVDIAHASDETFYDCLRVSKAPIVSTHSCCRALAGHRRNLSDEMLRALADRGGVVQINFYPVFLSDAFANVLQSSGLPDKDWIEREWIADPSDPAKTAAMHALQDEYAALPRPSWKVIVDHIDHAVQVAGIEHVGIGSDFDGIEVTPEGMENAGKMGRIFAEMHRRGYSDAAIAKVAGGNFLRVFKDVISSASASE